MGLVCGIPSGHVLAIAAGLALSAALGGCAGIQAERESQANQAENNAAYPADYKNDIIALMRTYLNDPTNVRDAYVTPPALRTFGSSMGGFERYASCLRYNAKKDGGQYAGIRDSVIIYRMGKLERIIDQGPERERCKDAPYQPFPELQRISR